jgi:hypothetical protein
VTGVTATDWATRPARNSDDAEPGKSRAILPFAVLGVITVSTIVIGWTRWITGPDFTPSPTGMDPISSAQLIFYRVFEWTFFVIGLSVAWLVLLRPLVRQRTFTFDGKLLLAVLLALFFDPVDNYFNFTFAYNAHLTNFASWTREIPGLQGPRQQFFAEPFLVMGGFYIALMFGQTIIGCWTLRKLRARYPGASTLALFGVLAIGIALGDLLVENVFMRTGMATYPGTVHSLTLWAGHVYQFPLYEPAIIAVFGCGLTALRWFRDDRGNSVVERGLDEMKAPPRVKGALSFFAIAGFMHVWFLASYFVPYNYFALKVDSFPPMPSYLLTGICGPGTGYACPSQNVPIPHGGSLHITPEDPRLPASQRSGG